jgi:hypothetical protein
MLGPNPKSLKLPKNIDFSENISSSSIEFSNNTNYKNSSNHILGILKTTTSKNEQNRRINEVVSSLQINPLDHLYYSNSTFTYPAYPSAINNLPVSNQIPSPIPVPVPAQEVATQLSSPAEVKDEKQAAPSAGRKPSFSR